MRLRCLSFVAVLCLLTVPVAAQIRVAQLDPTAPNGYIVVTFTPESPATMSGGPIAHGIIGACNDYSTSQTIRVECDANLVAEVGLLAGACWYDLSSMWPSCEAVMEVYMEVPPNGGERYIGKLVTLPGY